MMGINQFFIVICNYGLLNCLLIEWERVIINFFGYILSYDKIQCVFFICYF